MLKDRTRPEAAIELRILGKPDCCLCEDAKEILRRLSRDLPIRWQEIDITTDNALNEQYRESIPVILAEGREIARLKISEFRLRRDLTSLWRAKGSR